MMDMILVDRQDRSIVFAYVTSVDDARDLWCRIAGVSAGLNLCRFIVVDGDAGIVYRGDYVTDEC